MIEIRGVNHKYSGTIVFQNISADSFQELVRLTNKLKEEKDDSDSEIESVAFNSLPTVGSQNHFDSADVAVKPTVKPQSKVAKPEKEKPIADQNKVHDWDEEILEVLAQIDHEVDANPDKYERREVTMTEFMEAFKDKLGKFSAKNLGKVLTNLGLEKKAISIPGKGVRRVRNFPMPKIVEGKAEEKEEEKSPEKKEETPKNDGVNGRVDPKYWNVKQAGILKSKRQQVGLTKQELSNLIGYPYYSIQSWETCGAAPSPLAIDALCKRFGNSLRKELEAAAG